MSHLNQDEDNIEEQVDLILELMQTLNFNWLSYDFAKKTSILNLMSKGIVFGKESKDNPLIIWELPWNVLYALSTGSNMEGWHAQRFDIGTFLCHKNAISGLNRLRMMLK